ncbi:hypothetical protein [Lacrimispora indolis]|uniref:hypothetical protein n=1 Tax=Lacrimispora indolis TaxID=69825 RepID=UPI0004299F0B|nr:hypothetical protein [[Clostridium] methoxybenzovorans]
MYAGAGAGIIVVIMILVQRKKEDVIARDVGMIVEMLLVVGLMKMIATTNVIVR